MTSFSPAARRPAHATALGKALLAFAPADVLRRVRDGVVARLHPAHPDPPGPAPPRPAPRPVRRSCASTGASSTRTSAPSRCPSLGPGDIALAAVEVEVEDLSADTIATVTPVLTLAAHGLTRELHPSWRRERAGSPHPVRRGGAGVRRLTMPARRVPRGFARRFRRSSLARMCREWPSRALMTVGAISAVSIRNSDGVERKADTARDRSAHRSRAVAPPWNCRTCYAGCGSHAR